MGNSGRRKAVKKLRLLVFSQRTEVDAFRKKIEETFTSVFLPNRVEKTEVRSGTVACDLLTPEVYGKERYLLYVHGGSFVGGSRASWRSFCASLANETSTRVLVPEIRLAPQYPFPAALDDVSAVFHALPPDAESVILAADGSGASIALALVLSLPPGNRKKIRDIVLFSPVLNLVPDSSLFSAKKTADEIMTLDCLRRCGEIYTYRSNLSNPLVSPLEAPISLLEGLPPVFIQMGSEELLLADARRFAAKLDTAGGNHCTLDVWDSMMHLFQMADCDLAEAHRAMEKAGKYIKERLEWNL